MRGAPDEAARGQAKGAANRRPHPETFRSENRKSMVGLIGRLGNALIQRGAGALAAVKK